MISRQKTITVLVLIILLSLVAAFFIYPFSGIGKKILPWRLGLDLIGGSHLIYEIDMKDISANDRDLVISGLRDVIEKRVNLFGVAEPQVFTAISDESYRLIVELAGVKDLSAAIRQIGETPFLYFAEVSEAEISEKPEEEKQIVFKPTELTGRYIKGAQLAFDQITGESQVYLEFNDEGAKTFELLTEKNINKQIGVFLDNNLITAPVVREKISGGQAQITGKFTTAEAKQLVERFNAGALPAPINLVSQQTIGASLGADSLKKTFFAGLIGTILIMLFMIAYYRFYGLITSIALIIYIILTLTVFKGLSITMTLSGIAGVILSIGMAVDANILIFERMKEGIKKGLSRISAIEEGFKRAWPSIRDSNITTIISATILYYFTTSFVRGFALALLIGVIVSMFSAITISRTLLRTFIKQ
jgi:protein-export membrane protein SecD